MKKVLIISHFFAEEEIVGSLRTRGLARFLPKFGWAPIILTKTSDRKVEIDTRAIETQYEDISVNWRKRFGRNPDTLLMDQLKSENSAIRNAFVNKLIHIGVEILTYPDIYKGWFKSAIKVGEQLLREEQIDAILSTSGPIVANLIAKELKVRFEIPWAADFRDLWTQNHDYQYSKIRRMIERKLERKTLAYADALITVSEPWAEDLKRLHNTRRVYCIPNGFDPDLMNTDLHPSNLFTITYTGQIHRNRQDPEPLFAAIAKLISSGVLDPSTTKIEFYGRIDKDLRILADKYSLKEIVNLHGKTSRQEAILQQRRSQLLLLLTWNDPNVIGNYPAKVFEYLAARRPIIAIGTTGGVIEKLLKETGAGVFATSINEITQKLSESYDEFHRTGRVQFQGNESEIMKYNQEEMARKFSKILEDITGKHKDRNF